MAASPGRYPRSDHHQVEAESLQAAMTSGAGGEISLPVSRVASDRMKIFSCSMAFMRMRSPRSAPPVRSTGRWK